MTRSLRRAAFSVLAIAALALTVPASACAGISPLPQPAEIEENAFGGYKVHYKDGQTVELTHAQGEAVRRRVAELGVTAGFTGQSGVELMSGTAGDATVVNSVVAKMDNGFPAKDNKGSVEQLFENVAEYGGEIGTVGTGLVAGAGPLAEEFTIGLGPITVASAGAFSAGWIIGENIRGLWEPPAGEVAWNGKSADWTEIPLCEFNGVAGVLSGGGHCAENPAWKPSIEVKTTSGTESVHGAYDECDGVTYSGFERGYVVFEEWAMDIYVHSEYEWCLEQDVAWPYKTGETCLKHEWLAPPDSIWRENANGMHAGCAASGEHAASGSFEGEALETRSTFWRGWQHMVWPHQGFSIPETAKNGAKVGKTVTTPAPAPVAKPSLPTIATKGPMGEKLTPQAPPKITTVIIHESSLAEGSGGEAAPAETPNPLVATIAIPPYGESETGTEYQAALQTDGLTKVTLTVLPWQQADHQKLASAVVHVSPAVGTYVEPEEAITVEANPAVMPVEIPPPGAQTAVEYEHGLNELGFTHVTTQVLTGGEASPRVGPDGVVKVSPEVGTYVGPENVSSTEVAVTANPAASVQQGLGSGEGTTNGEGTTPPEVEAGCGLKPPKAELNLKPLESQLWTERFPFSMVVFVEQSISGIAAEPAAPNATFYAFGKPLGNLSFLQEFGSVFAIWRAALSFLLTIGVALWLWRRTLGRAG